MTSEQHASQTVTAEASAGSHDYLWRKGEVGPKHEWAKRFAVGQRVLDVGAGSGSLAVYLARQGYAVTAMDLTRSEALQATSVPWTTADAGALPFRGAAFDTTLLFDVLEHVENQDIVLQETRRVTTKRLLMSVPSADDGVLPKYNMTYKHQKDRTHLRTYTINQLTGLLTSHGFKVAELTPAGPVWPHLLVEFVALRFGRRIIKDAIDFGLRTGLLANPGLYADIFVAADCV